MFRNTFQSGFLSILYSIGSKPLQLWDAQAEEGRIERVVDEDISSSTVELRSPNVSTTSITCPASPSQSLGVKLPFLVLVLKNLGDYFTFEVAVLDHTKVKRRFRASNFQTTTRVNPSMCTMPLRLEPGWNVCTFDLADFVKRAYGTDYVEALRVTVHANCRLRRIYFAERLCAEEELPPEFRLFLPSRPQQGGGEAAAAEDDGDGA